MRFLTFETNGAQRPGLLAEDGRIVDLTAAIADARDRGALSFEGAVPVSRIGDGDGQIDDPAILGQQTGSLRAVRFERQKPHGSLGGWAAI